jgi:protein-L-isoaspartate(D-aspartate) O-methyltransferase
MNWVRRMLADGGSETARERLLARLRADPAISSEAIAAIAAVPRERFVPPEYAELAYEDAALEIGPAATISAPSMVAAMLTALELKPEMKVLEIGAGSGYAAATVAALGCWVIGLELQPELAELARRNIAAAGFAERVKIIAADGAKGWEAEAPYDRILVSAAVEAIPQDWLHQVADGGMIVYPEAGRGVDLLVRLIREGQTFRREEKGHCLFVRLQLGGAKPPTTDFE